MARLVAVFRGPPGSVQGLARPADLGWSYSFVSHPGNLESLRVICRRGRVLSLVAIYDTEVRTTGGTLRVGGVRGVGTHPDYRGQGLLASLGLERDVDVAQLTTSGEGAQWRLSQRGVVGWK